VQFEINLRNFIVSVGAASNEAAKQLYSFRGFFLRVLEVQQVGASSGKRLFLVLVGRDSSLI